MSEDNGESNGFDGAGADETAVRAAAPLPVAVLSDRERVACLRLVRSDTVGPVTFRALINRFGGAEAAINALPDLARRGGRKHAPRIPSVAMAEDELAAAERVRARSIFTIEPDYPARLAALDAPPPMIYAAGHAALLNAPSVAVVGSRRASAAGQSLARQIAGGLGQAGLVTVSGLARGIDAVAHHASLETGTVAVVAGGVDVIYPPENEGLHRDIAERGVVISEMPPGFRPRGKDFPRRNRLISGVALAVLVVEAAERSGTLITARLAAEQGREVFAVPGHPLDPRAAGTNRLLKDGATIVTSVDDILTGLAPFNLSGGGFQEAGTKRYAEAHPANGANSPLAELAVVDASQASGAGPAGSASAEIELADNDANRRRIIAALGPAPTSVDDIARASHLPVGVVNSVLLELSLAGRIEHHGGQLISLRND